MDKPITLKASQATHGNEEVTSASPNKYVNKMKAKTSTMIHEYWPKMQGKLEEGVKAAKTDAALNQNPLDEEECGEGYIKNEAGQCVESKNLNTDPADTGTGTVSTELEGADQSGGDGN